MTHAILDITIHGITGDPPHYPFEMTLSQSDGGGIGFAFGNIHREIENWICPSLDDQESGQSLFDLFIAEQLRKKWPEIRDSYEHWHIRLHLDDHDSLNALHALPWEYLHDTTGQSLRYIAADRKTPFSRYMPNDSQFRALRKRPIRMLLAIASPVALPDGMAEVNVEAEKQVIGEGLTGLTNGQVELVIMEQPVTLKSLEASLKDSTFDILHIVGHGRYLSRFSRDGKSHAFLYLSHADGTVHEVMDDDFAAMLSRLGDQHPQFIFLASCQTAQRDKGDPWQGFAPKLMRAGIPAVLAMQDRVNIPTAQIFVSTFYHDLFRHGYVDLACNAARATVLTAEHRGSHVPVLFSRLPDGQLFQVQGNLSSGRDYKPPIPPAPGDPPYKGMFRYNRADAHLFFGRKTLTQELVKHLEKHTFLAIVGASGSGKSSLARAGLIPALLRNEGEEKDDSWHIHVVKPSNRPFEELSIALYPDEKDNSVIRKFATQMMDDPTILRTRLATVLRRSGKQRLLLFVDQFEELFTNYHEPNDKALERMRRRNYILNLLYAAGITSESADPSPEMNPITVLLALRADFYANCAAVTELRIALERHQKFIGVMSKDETARAITGPGGDIWEIQPALVERMLRDVGYVEDQEPEPGSLPLLSHALRETWEKRSGYAMTLEGYESIGGVRGAIARTAETTFQALDEQQQKIARDIFVDLVELGDDEGIPDTRRPVKRDELLLQDGNEVGMTSVLNALVKARLITISADEVEVAHEALIREWEAIRKWLKESREDIRYSRLLKKRVTEWLKAGKPNSELLTPKEMALIRAWRKKSIYVLTQQQEQYLATSQRVDQLRRLWNWATAFLFSTLMLIGILIFGSNYWLDHWPWESPNTPDINVTTPDEQINNAGGGSQTEKKSVINIDCTKINGISEEECKALSALYDSTDGPNWRIDTWLWKDSNNPCKDWYGITCRGGHITEVILRGDENHKLGLKGNIPAEIGVLTELTSLLLGRNSLKVLPKEIETLTNLIYLELSFNQLTNLPTEIGQLSSLERLWVRNNQLTDTPLQIENLSRLIELDIMSNHLYTLPNEIGNLTNLKHLYLDFNNLMELPTTFANLTNLSSLKLGRNCLAITDPSLEAWANKKDPDWADSQNDDCRIPIPTSTRQRLTACDVLRNRNIDCMKPRSMEEYTLCLEYKCETRPPRRPIF